VVTPDGLAGWLHPAVSDGWLHHSVKEVVLPDGHGKGWFRQTVRSVVAPPVSEGGSARRLVVGRIVLLGLLGYLAIRTRAARLPR